MPSMNWSIIIRHLVVDPFGLPLVEIDPCIVDLVSRIVTKCLLGRGEWKFITTECWIVVGLDHAEEGAKRRPPPESRSLYVVVACICIRDRRKGWLCWHHTLCCGCDESEAQLEEQTKHSQLVKG